MTAISNLMSINRAALQLGMTRKAIYDAIERGALIRVYIDNKPFVTLSSVAKFKKRPYRKNK